jgi:hypothetical protein
MYEKRNVIVVKGLKWQKLGERKIPAVVFILFCIIVISDFSVLSAHVLVRAIKAEAFFLIALRRAACARANLFE